VIHIHKVLVQIQFPHHLEVQYLSFLQCVVEMWKYASTCACNGLKFKSDCLNCKHISFLWLNITFHAIQVLILRSVVYFIIMLLLQ
jgi:hypothetical protein